LETLSELADTLGQMRKLQQERIATMQRDLDHYASIAKALAAELASDLVDSAPDIISETLSRRLVEAEKAKDRRDRATEERNRAGKVIADARDKRQRAEAALGSLFDRAGSREIATLREAIRRSEQAAELEAEIAKITQIILEQGDGLSLGELEAEVAAEDVTSINPRLAELERQREEAHAEREQRLLDKNTAERDRARIDGSAAAAEAEAMRQEALAEMATATERFITVFVAGRLLRWAIERFRVERQDPLLRQAAGIFRGLTSGSFADLTVDYQGETPHLLGRRGDGTHVGVDGMSEGTRDQLYLALRLAAIELHLKNGSPLPFIADDLFVNFDDDRAVAGFQALAALARHTQVIFLSHHKHLVDIARNAIGYEVTVVSL
jgi:uncharacterized protein YhaN